MGSSMLHLHRNEYHFGHSSTVASLLGGPISHPSVSSYADRETLATFVEHIATTLAVSAERITLYHGAEDALFKLLGWASGRSMRVYTTTWGWTEYMRMMQGFNLNVHQTPLKTESDRFLHPVSEFEQDLLRTTDPSLILLASPNNPTGHSIGQQELARLATTFPLHTFIIDSVYSSFGAESFSQLSEFDNVINLGSFSKFFGLPGLRCGFAVGKVPDAHAMALGPSPLSIALCGAALRDIEHYKLNWTTMQLCAKRLQGSGHSGAGRFFKTDAPFVLFQCSEKIDELKIEKAQEHSRVRGKVFTAQGALYIRWSLTSPMAEERIKECLKYLEDTL